MNWNIEYFENGDRGETDPTRPPGYVILSPYSGALPGSGYIKRVANSNAEVHALDKKIRRQTELDFEREAEHDYNLTQHYQKSLDDRINARMRGEGVDPSHQAYVRDFFMYLRKLRDDHPKKQYFMNQLDCYLAVLHNDVGNRIADREVVDLDKVNARIESYGKQ